MAMIARQFERPRGLLGHLIGRGMARRNGDFSRWVVGEVGKQCAGEEMRIVELGPGPGVGLQEILRVFPRAQVWGVDLSGEMLSQSRKRNLAAACPIVHEISGPDGACPPMFRPPAPPRHNP